MAVTATLRVQLLANEVIVAESDSSTLWHSVFQAMEKGEALGRVESRQQITEGRLPTKKVAGHEGADDPTDAFAHELGLDRDVIEGSCGPSGESPHIQLDKHHWEALRKNTGERGPKA